MRRLPVVLVACVVFAAAAAAAWYWYPQAPPAAPPPDAAAVTAADMVGQARPDFTLPDLQGRPRHIGEWDGRVVALNFWATWCPPCLKEIPRLITLQSRYGGQGLQIVGIALQKPGDVSAFVRRHGMNYPVLAGEMPVVKVAESYGDSIGALPYTVVIDRQGRIAYTKQGPVTVQEIHKVIQPLL